MKKPTRKQLEEFMDHPGEIDDVLQAFQDDTVNYLPYQIVIDMIENNLYTPD